MRIGLVSDTYTPQVNGVTTVVRRIVSLLRAQGHEALVVAPRYPNGTETRDAHELRIPSAAFPLYPEIRMALPPFRRIAGLFDASPPDIVHVHTEGALEPVATELPPVSAALDALKRLQDALGELRDVQMLIAALGDAAAAAAAERARPASAGLLALTRVAVDWRDRAFQRLTPTGWRARWPACSARSPPSRTRWRPLRPPRSPACSLLDRPLRARAQRAVPAPGGGQEAGPRADRNRAPSGRLHALPTRYTRRACP